MTTAGYMLVFTVLATSAWVWFDAMGRDWHQQDNFWFRSAGGWVIGCLVFWVLVFPVYLVKRRKVPAVDRSELG